MMSSIEKQCRFNVLNEQNKTDFPMLAVDGAIGPKSREAFRVAETAWGEDWLSLPLPEVPYFVDSYGAVTPKLIELLKAEVGYMPKLWGRYLSDFEASAPEVALLAEHAIPLLGIDAVPTRSRDIIGDEKAGRKHARAAVSKLQSLPNASKLVFLDVEHQPTLATDFYLGWSQTIADAGLEPCVYLPNYHYHPDSWHTLQAAMDAGAPFRGSWVAWYTQTDKGAAKWIPHVWEPFHSQPADHTPNGAGPFGPNLAWQCVGNAYGKVLDFSVVNPEFLADVG